MMRPMLKASRLGMASLLVVALVSAAGSAVAANDKKDGKEQARRLQQKINALEQEKSQLVQAKSQLEGQLKETIEQLNHVKQSAEASNRKGSSLGKALKAAEGDKTELADKLAKSEQKLVETAETLRQTQESRSKLEASLSARTQEYSACTTKNESLYRVGVALIKQYEEKGCLSSLLQKEPLTQLKSVEAENMLEEYREKLDQELVNQPLEESQKLAQQKAEQEKAKQLKAEQEKAEQLKAAQLKAKQQNSLDRMTRKVKKFFKDLEW